jgi:chromosome segregation and condensation protein ScpB
MLELEQSANITTTDEATLDDYETRMKLEAVLFSVPDGLTISELHNVASHLSVESLTKQLESLKEQYQNYQGSLEVVLNPNHKYQIRVKHAIMTRKEVNCFTRGEIFTQNEVDLLSFIAYNQPIELQDIVDLLGSKVKKYVKNLEEKGFIQYVDQYPMIFRVEGHEETIPTSGYITTAEFADYFSIPNEIWFIKEYFDQKISK